jgi:hypothetical protein
MRFAALGIAILSLSACIVYDDRNAGYTNGGSPRPDGGTEAPVPPSEAFWLVPDAAVAGDTVIVSLYSNGQTSLDELTSLTFIGQGGIDVIATSSRGQWEHLLTVQVPPETATGTFDLMLEFESGDVAWRPMAFLVTGLATDTDTDTDTDTGADTGTETDTDTDTDSDTDTDTDSDSDTDTGTEDDTGGVDTEVGDTGAGDTGA